MATFTNKDRRTYQNICHLKQSGILHLMRDLLELKYGKDNVIQTPSYVCAYGDIPVALVAHADTVFKLPPSIDKFFYDEKKDVIWNPEGMGADDRAGIFAIMKIVRNYGLKPHVIITTDEEVGCIGAGKLIGQMPVFIHPLKFMIQLDRRGHDDAVYYECNNTDFENFITPFGFHTQWGTLSDICILAPVWGVAAVNFSVGYINEHTETEHLHVDWLYETIDKVVKILNHVASHEDVPVFKYIAREYYGSYYYNGYNYGYKGHSSFWWDDDDNDYNYGLEKCCMCNRPDKPSNMIPIYFPLGTKEHMMCLDCHADLVDQIIWCKTCGKGYYVSKLEASSITDKNNWVCGECKKKNELSENSGTVQSSASVQSEHLTESEHRINISNLVEKQTVVSGQNKPGTDLRISRTYLL